MQANLTVKRVEAGSYKCSINGIPFNVWQCGDREVYGVALKHANRFGSYSTVWSRTNHDWAYSFGKDLGDRGCGSKKQAIASAIKFAEYRNLEAK